MSARDNHQVEVLKGIYSGMALGVAPDIRIKDKFNFGQNIRTIFEGVIESRPKVDSYLTCNPAQVLVPHSMGTLVNKITGQINRVVGIDTKIFTGSGTPLAQKVTGFSGNPLTIVPFRPEDSVEANSYIGDSAKICKISSSDVVTDIGISVPTKAAIIKQSKPNRKTIDNITTANVGDWNNLTGSAGVPVAVTRVNQTISACLLDEVAAPCWASIVPNAFTQEIQAGTILTLNGADDVYVESVMPAVLLTGLCTVSSIVYDVGTTGLCTIVLSLPSEEIDVDTVLFLNGTEYVRVIEVRRDANSKIPSIRVKTVGTIANTQTVIGAASFRTWVINSYAVGNTIFSEALKSTIAAFGISSLTKTINVDLTNTGSTGVPLNDNDFIHFSVKLSDPSKLVEFQFQADCNNGAQNFTDNYFFNVVSPNFFLSSVTQSSTIISTIQQADQKTELTNKLLRLEDQNNFGQQTDLGIDPFFQTVASQVDSTSVVSESESGLIQWTEVFIRIGDLKRVGSDDSRTKKDIKALRISINCSVAIDVYLDSIWIGGGIELDSRPFIQGILPYFYIWRVRDSDNKVPSNWSPPNRNGFSIKRNSLELSFPNANTDFSVNYMIDIARFGGTINDYRIIGTIKNNGSTFIDKVSDRVASQNPPAGRFLTGDQIGDEEVFDFYKPFTFLDTPKRGTCNVKGTTLTITSTANLDLSYPRGTIIRINNTPNSFYTNPTSTSIVELENDMGVLTAVDFEIIAPLLVGQTLPTIFGPFGEGVSGLFLFAVGNKKAVGTLYWTDGNSPDTMSDINYLEVTSPSEPILAGGMYDSYPFIFTNKKSFMISPTYQGNTFSFLARENANSRGVFCREAICFGRDFIYFLSENADGIYAVPGNGNPQNLTDGSLYPLFYHNGIAPSQAILSDGTVVNPPDFTKTTDLRLFDSKDFLFFRFVDINSSQVALVFDKRIKDWISYDTYLNGKINCFYEEEIDGVSRLLVGIEGEVGIFAGATSREDSIDSKLYPFFNDSNDSRLLKQYDELGLDVVTGVGGFTFRNYFNNGALSETAIVVAGNANPRGFSYNSIANILARNISTYLTFKLNSGFKFYQLTTSFLVRDDLITNRPSDSDSAGVFGEKFWQGFIIEADTFGEDKVLKFYNDEGVLVDTKTINHIGKETKSYSFDNPFIAHSVTRVSTDGVDWIHYQIEYKFNLEPELGKVWEGQPTTFGIKGFKQQLRNVIVVRSFADSTLKWTYDNSNIVDEYSIPNTNGLKVAHPFFIKSRKGQILRPRIESVEAFRVYLNDCEVHIRGTNSPNDYQILKPFGDQDYNSGIRI